MIRKGLSLIAGLKNSARIAFVASFVRHYVQFQITKCEDFYLLQKKLSQLESEGLLQEDLSCLSQAHMYVLVML